ncbi:MAG: NACHT domain-containing protein [Deltaproteobacteria bacterium]|nr:NACHT domain-containing protein [Deltaproteobacteria bacterium]
MSLTAGTAIALAKLGSSEAAKKALANVIEKVVTLATEKGLKWIQDWKNQNSLELVHKRLRGIRSVKTVWQIEKHVDLLKFYYPSKVIINDQRRTIRDLADFGCDDSLVVQGTVGQGKSIFFRYLVSKEVYNGQVIPLFVELRRVAAGSTLVDHIASELTTLGLPSTSETVAFLAEHGKLILFLDAFDEVKDDQRPELLAQMEQLLTRSEKLRILVSSRPDSGIAASPKFRVVNLSPLDVGTREYEAVIQRIAPSQDIALQVVQGINKASFDLRQLLTTPLMVTLLVFRYQADQSIPEQVVDFYSRLFDLLLNRHDGSKPGYRRPRTSKAGDKALEDIFSGICFLTRRKQQGSFSKRDLVKITQEAITATGQLLDAEHVFHDLVHITCLILVEGDECRFLHKSVQEYHAALFIREQPDESIKSFLQTAMRGSNWNVWLTELRFLEEMIPYTFFKWLAIPDIREAFGMGPADQATDLVPSKELAIRVFGNFEILVEDMRVYAYRSSDRWCSQYASLLFANEISARASDLPMNELLPSKRPVDSGANASAQGKTRRLHARQMGSSDSFRLKALLLHPAFPHLVTVAMNALDTLRARLIEYESHVDRVERQQPMFSLLNDATPVKSG